MATLPVERTTFEQVLEAYLQQFATSGGGTGGTGTILPERLTIINAVKAKIDELIPEGEGVQFTVADETNVSNPYDIFINVILDETAKELLLIAPLHVLNPTSANASGTQMLSDDWGQTGYIVLPSDFLRLQSLKMVEWERPVTMPITTLDPLYPLQKNKFVRGGVSKPVAVLSFNGSAKVLEYYSVQNNHTVDHLRYIPETLPENLQNNIMDAYTWLVANKVLQIVGSVDLSALAYEKAVLSFKDMQ